MTRQHQMIVNTVLTVVLTVVVTEIVHYVLDRTKPAPGGSL